MSKRLDLIMPKTHNFINLTGQTFGRLTVMSIHSIKKVKWLCQCSCGNKTVVATDRLKLKNGGTKSCGCYHKDIVTKHGMWKTRFYRIWKKMKSRCSDKNNTQYSDYGGRGVSVCNRWKKFENFRNDMYQSYILHVNQFGEKNTTIERKNNNGNYELDNPCVWATKKEQGNNRTTNHLITFNDKTLNVTQWAEKLNINSSTLHNRIFNYKWPINKAFTAPVKLYKNRKKSS